MSDIRGNYPKRNDGRKDANGFWLADTIADLTVEPELKPGEDVITPCDMCDASGKDRYDEGEDCWRCKGKGECTHTVEMEYCVRCGESFQGEQIALKHQTAYGSTHFSKKMGMYGMDQTLAYRCQECGTLTDRYTGKVLDKDGEAELAKKMQRAY